MFSFSFSPVLLPASVCLTLLVLLSVNDSTAAIASDGQEGRGGDVVACFSSSEVVDRVEGVLRANAKGEVRKDPLDGIHLGDVHVQQYDLYLTRLPRMGESPVIRDRTNLDILLSEIDTLIARTNADFYRDLKVAQNALAWKRNHWVEVGTGVIAINDSEDAILLPSNCLLLQIAHQTIIGSQATIYYDSRLFGRMSVVDQAGLIFHEWVYNRHVANARPKGSGATQQIVGVLFREDFGPRRADGFASLLRNVGYFGKPGQSAPSHCEFRNVEILNFRIEDFFLLVDEARFEIMVEGERLKFMIHKTSGGEFPNQSMVDRLQEAFSDRRLVRLTLRPATCPEKTGTIDPERTRYIDAIERVQFEQ